MVHRYDFFKSLRFFGDFCTNRYDFSVAFLTLDLIFLRFLAYNYTKSSTHKVQLQKQF